MEDNSGRIGHTRGSKEKLASRASLARGLNFSVTWPTVQYSRLEYSARRDERNEKERERESERKERNKTRQLIYAAVQA